MRQSLDLNFLKGRGPVGKQGIQLTGAHVGNPLIARAVEV